MIKSWFVRTFLQRNRLLFRYWDGSRFVRADPAVIMRDILATNEFDLFAKMKQAGQPNPKYSFKAIGEIADFTRKLFDLPPFEKGGKGGLTELECMQLAGSFLNYCQALKKNGGQMPTMQPPTETPAAESSPPPSDEKGDTNGNSVSG